MKNLILASASPRRKEILQSLKIDFTVCVPDFDETSVFGKSQNYEEAFSSENEPLEICRKIAYGKMQSVYSLFLQKKEKGSDEGDSLILAADTLVFCGNRIFGKPEDRAEAAKMLSALTGRGHSVVTALSCISCSTGKCLEKQCLSRVYFKNMSSAEIDFYLSTNEWQGVAGAYRIQERGGFFIEKIEGSYSNIVGLPVHDLYEILTEFDFKFAKNS